LDSPSFSYHDNGQLRSEGNHKDGKEDGPWDDYHDNGQLKSKGTYKDGEWDGPWVSYNKDGTVWDLFIGTYMDGMLVQ
jgi:antitoxin component YwqK of YwqJK toxin-antitoxin module